VGLHRELLSHADAVLLVLGSRQEQLHAGFAQLETLIDELGIGPDRLRVVVNGQGSAGAVPSAEANRAISAELAKHGLAVDAWIPWDRRALRSSVRLGLPLALARPRGGYARALGGLIEAVLLPSLPQPAARKQRLRTPVTIARASAHAEEVALPWRR
jgi:hypothetical protein